MPEMTRRQLLFATMTPLLAGAGPLPTAYTDSRRRTWRITDPSGALVCAYGSGPFPPYAIVAAPSGPWDALPEMLRRIEESA
jgi:hypothetical protein